MRLSCTYWPQNDATAASALASLLFATTSRHSLSRIGAQNGGSRGHCAARGGLKITVSLSSATKFERISFFPGYVSSAQLPPYYWHQGNIFLNYETLQVFRNYFNGWLVRWIMMIQLYRSYNVESLVNFK
jgi:hypothetical protein